MTVQAAPRAVVPALAEPWKPREALGCCDAFADGLDLSIGVYVEEQRAGCMLLFDEIGTHPTEE